MTSEVATNFAIRKVEASRPHIAMRMIGLSVPTRKAAHEPEGDMRLRVMALAASVLATVAASTISHVNGSFRSEDAEPNTRQIGDLAVLDSPIAHRQSAKTDLPSWPRELKDSLLTESRKPVAGVQQRDRRQGERPRPRPQSDPRGVRQICRC
jgi:hypothetical protein